MKNTLIFFLIILPFLTFGQAEKWRGTNQDGHYPDTHLMDTWPNDTLQVLATYTDIGEGYGSPSITENGLFVAGMHDTIGYVYHFKLNGELVWKTEYGRDYTYRFPGSRGTPRIEDGRVFYSGAEGDVVCLNTKTGEVIWHVNIFEKYDGELIKWGYTESVLVYKDVVILQPGGKNIALCALNKTDGSVVWEKSLGGNVNAYCSPKIFQHNGDTLCMLEMSESLLIFDPINGDVKINHPLTDSHKNHSNEPVYQDGQLFYSSGYGEGSVMFKINNEELRLDTLWQNPHFDSKLSGIHVVDGIIYGTADRKKHWSGIRWDSGEEVFTSREIKPGSFVMADNKFYIFTDNGEIVLAKPSPEGVVFMNRFESPAFPAKHAYAFPVIYKGDLFIRFNNDVWRYRIAK